MSPIAAGLDGLLAVLLLLALGLGLRLNGRLKALRESQAGFAAAVIELNQAAARAEAGLAALKTASGEAHDELLARIETARGLATRLERASAQAERSARDAGEGRGPVLERPAPDRAGATPARPLGGTLAAIAALAEGRSGGERTAAAPARAGASARSTPPPTRRASSPVDDDLFETRAPDPDALGPLRTPSARRDR